MDIYELFKREVDIGISVTVAVLVLISLVLNGIAMRIIYKSLKPDSFVNPTLNIIFK